MLCVIGEKHCVFYVVFLTKFSKKLLCQCCFSGCKQLYVQEFVCLGINSSVQPKLLAIDSDHRFVERNVIRTRLVSWL